MICAFHVVRVFFIATPLSSTVSHRNAVVDTVVDATCGVAARCVFFITTSLVDTVVFGTGDVVTCLRGGCYTLGCTWLSVQILSYSFFAFNYVLSSTIMFILVLSFFLGLYIFLLYIVFLNMVVSHD